MASPSKSNAAASGFLDFVNESPTPFHAVASASDRLEKAGFERLSEKTTWSSLQAGKAYFYTRNQSALVAFVLPKKFESGVDGVGCVATHVDSCCLKVRPISRKEKGDYMQVAVETYGGGIWRSWFDRDLSLAGRVIVATSSNKFESKLVNLRRPLLRIPSLAIHLDRDSAESFKFNKETQFTPILGLASAQLNAAGKSSEKGDGKEKHWSGLIEVLAEELGVRVEDVKDFELSLYDTQSACLGGLQNEFLFAPRMDNLLSSFAAVEALAESYTSDSFASTSSTSAQAILLFDNEEVGSVSHHGAESSLLPELISRLTNAGINTSASSSSSIPVANRVEEVFAKSFLISADMGHGIHPNFPEKHQELNQPTLGKGVVIKTNANQRYTSTAATTFLIRRVAEHAGVALQEFEVRNDMGCGSTVGPHLSTNLRCVDVGLAQLSMHSIRETAAASDVPTYISFMRAFLEQFGRVDGELRVD